MSHYDANDSKHDIVLRADQAAFIISKDGSCEIVLPRHAGGVGLSPAQSIILAIAVRIDDPDWIEEMIEAAKSPPSCAVVH
jgi:hypothetical protein